MFSYIIINKTRINTLSFKRSEIKDDILIKTIQFPIISKQHLETVKSLINEERFNNILAHKDIDLELFQIFERDEYFIHLSKKEILTNKKEILLDFDEEIIVFYLSEPRKINYFKLLELNNLDFKSIFWNYGYSREMMMDYVSYQN